jgi:hypothetical protein
VLGALAWKPTSNKFPFASRREANIHSGRKILSYKQYSKIIWPNEWGGRTLINVHTAKWFCFWEQKRNKFHIIPYANNTKSHSLAQTVKRWFLTGVPSPIATSCEISCRRRSTSADYTQIMSSFPLLITIPPLLHTRLLPPSELSDNPDQAAHYHILIL